MDDYANYDGVDLAELVRKRAIKVQHAASHSVQGKLPPSE